MPKKPRITITLPDHATEKAIKILAAHEGATISKLFAPEVMRLARPHMFKAAVGPSLITEYPVMRDNKLRARKTPQKSNRRKGASI